MLSLSEMLLNLPYFWKNEKKQNICGYTFFQNRFYVYIIVNVDAIGLRCAFFLLSILNESFKIGKDNHFLPSITFLPYTRTKSHFCNQ